MKIPKSIRIAGVEYPVKIVKGPLVINTNEVCYGCIDYDNFEIQISEDASAEHQHCCITLLHEILHALRENNGMKIENEEAVVDMFAKGIYQVLQDNGVRLFDLLLESGEGVN